MLGVAMHTTIQTLSKKGYNKTQIAKILEIDRKTVRRVLNELNEKGIVERKETCSILDPYKEYIQIQVTKDLKAIRIYQDLVREFGFQGSYDTVKKYVAKIKNLHLKHIWYYTVFPVKRHKWTLDILALLNFRTASTKRLGFL